MRRPESAAASCSISRNSGFVRWKLQLAVNSSPFRDKSRIARRLMSLYPRIAAGSDARVFANAGGSSTIVSKRRRGSPFAQIVERVRLDELDVRDAIAREVLPGARERVGRTSSATTVSARRARCSANEPW